MWMLVTNLVGAAVYAVRVSSVPHVFSACRSLFQVPERWVRISCGICGSSHQIFHVLVVVAALLHLCGLVQALHAVRASTGICGL